MNEQPEKILRQELWEELKLLQPIIDKFDDIALRIKNWFVTIFIAAAGFAFYEKVEYILWLNFLLTFIFYVYEVSYRFSHMAFIERSRVIQEILREEREFHFKYMAPNISPSLQDEEKRELPSSLISKCILTGIDFISKCISWLTKKYLQCLGVDGNRRDSIAKANADMVHEIFIRIPQLRITALYWGATFFNALLLCAYHHGRTWYLMV